MLSMLCAIYFIYVQPMCHRFYLCGALLLRGRMPNSQSSEPGFETSLLLFRRLGILVLSTIPQLTQMYKVGYLAVDGVGNVSD